MADTEHFTFDGEFVDTDLPSRGPETLAEQMGAKVGQVLHAAANNPHLATAKRRLPGVVLAAAAAATSLVLASTPSPAEAKQNDQPTAGSTNSPSGH